MKRSSTISILKYKVIMWRLGCFVNNINWAKMSQKTEFIFERVRYAHFFKMQWRMFRVLEIHTQYLAPSLSSTQQTFIEGKSWK
jgi:hypothetical protein